MKTKATNRNFSNFYRILRSDFAAALVCYECKHGRAFRSADSDKSTA